MPPRRPMMKVSRREGPSSPSGRPGLAARDILLAVGLTAIGAALAWALLTQTMAESLSKDHPARALAWSSNNAGALSRMAETGPPAGAETFARRAIAADPMEGAAFRTLALAAEQRGDKAAAERLMTIAGRRLKRDIPAQTWLIRDDVSKGHFDSALERIDGLMRAWPYSMQDRMTAALTGLASDAQASKAVARRLEADPPWRTRFLIDLSQNAVDPTAPFAIFSALQSSKSPPTRIEGEAYIGRLVRERLFQQAFLTWVQLLPPEGVRNLGDLYDGAFEGLPGPAPFNWQMMAKDNASISEAPDREGKALSLMFSGGKAPVSQARQMLVLPPGNYVLSGDMRAQQVNTVRGLAWIIRCAEGSGTPIATSPALDADSGWKPFSVAFTVRPDACSAQWLILQQAARGASEARPTGEFWYDNLKITRAPG